MIDSLYNYAPDQVFQMISAYGEQGRSFYILTTLTADLLYPLDYSLLLSLLIIATYRQAFPGGRMVYSMSLFPIHHCVVRSARKRRRGRHARQFSPAADLHSPGCQPLYLSQMGFPGHLDRSRSGWLYWTGGCPLEAEIETKRLFIWHVLLLRLRRN